MVTFFVYCKPSFLWYLLMCRHCFAIPYFITSAFQHQLMKLHHVSFLHEKMSDEYYRSLNNHSQKTYNPNPLYHQSLEYCHHQSTPEKQQGTLCNQNKVLHYIGLFQVSYALLHRIIPAYPADSHSLSFGNALPGHNVHSLKPSLFAGFVLLQHLKRGFHILHSSF